MQFTTPPICGSVIKSLGYFESFLLLEDKFEVIPIIVTICKKNHGLFGNDVLYINSTKLINETKMKKTKKQNKTKQNKTGKLKNYKASLTRKENVTPSYYEARKVSVHFLPLVVAKLWKLIEHDLLEHFPSEGSKWTSPIVVLRTSDGDIGICGDHRIGVNHKVCSDSYTIANVEVAIHALAGMSVFTKIDLKTAYHQIPTDNNFKEAMTITRQ